MLPNDLNLSLHNPILIYSLLALYGVLTVLILTYVQAKFRLAAKTLKIIQTEWQDADSRHARFMGAAQEQLSKLTVSTPVAPLIPVHSTAVNFDVRTQVVAMAKRGIGPSEIARASGLQEGEVEVLLGMARLQR